MNHDSYNLTPNQIENILQSHLAQGNYKDALPLLHHATSKFPNHLPFLINLGNVLLKLNHIPEATAKLVQAFKRDSHNPLLLNSLASCYKLVFDFPKARYYWESALDIVPDFHSARYNLANLEFSDGNYSPTIQHLQQLIGTNFQPESVLLKLSLAHCFNNQPTLAMDRFVDLLKLQTHLEKQQQQLLERPLNQLKALLDYYQDLLQASPATIYTYFLQSANSGQLNRLELSTSYLHHINSLTTNINQILPHLYYTLHAHPQYPLQIPQSTPSSLPAHLNQSISIGFIAGTYSNHPTTYLLRSILPHLSHSHILHLVSTSPQSLKQIDSLFPNTTLTYHQLSQLSNLSQLQYLKSLNLDFLIDLMGHTPENSLHLLQHHPARRQPTYLGYPAPTFSPSIDSIILDPIVYPLELSNNSAEPAWLLPHSYQPPNISNPPPDPTITRLTYKIHKDIFILANLNHPLKLTQLQLDLYIQLLKRFPHLMIWLYQPNQDATHQLRLQLANQDINPARLLQAPHQPHPIHLARIKLADLAIDSFPCNGHTTSSDALSVNTPVVTLTGSTIASRVTASLLASVGLTELITHNLADFFNLVNHLIQSPTKLATIRAKLSQHLTSYPLTDPARYSTNLSNLLYKSINSPRSSSILISDPLPLNHVLSN